MSPFRQTTADAVERRAHIAFVFDRLLASRLGAAIQIAEGTTGVLVGHPRSDIVPTPLDEVITTPRRLDPALLGTGL